MATIARIRYLFYLDEVTEEVGKTKELPATQEMSEELCRFFREIRDEEKDKIKSIIDDFFKREGKGNLEGKLSTLLINQRSEKSEKVMDFTAILEEKWVKISKRGDTFSVTLVECCDENSLSECNPKQEEDKASLDQRSETKNAQDGNAKQEEDKAFLGETRCFVIESEVPNSQNTQTRAKDIFMKCAQHNSSSEPLRTVCLRDIAHKLPPSGAIATGNLACLYDPYNDPDPDIFVLACSTLTGSTVPHLSYYLFRLLPEALMAYHKICWLHKRHEEPTVAKVKSSQPPEVPSPIKVELKKVKAELQKELLECLMPLQKPKDTSTPTQNQPAATLEIRLSKLADKYASMARHLMLFEHDLKAMQVNQSNLERFLDEYSLPKEGFLQSIVTISRDKVRQVEADMEFYRIVMQQADTTLNAVQMRAEIERERREHAEDERDQQRNLILGFIAVILTLGQLIGDEVIVELLRDIGVVMNAAAPSHMQIFFARLVLLVGGSLLALWVWQGAKRMWQMSQSAKRELSASPSSANSQKPTEVKTNTPSSD